MENSLLNKFPEIWVVDTNMLQKIKADLSLLQMFDIVQTTIIFLTLFIGFCILLYSLFDRRRKTVWGLWCALLCGFIQVCYCSASVFAAKRRNFRPEPASMQCTDIYTIPMFCDVFTLSVIVISAFGAHVKSSKAAILKPILFVYIMISSVFVIALQSWTINYTSDSFMLTANIQLQPTSCSRDPDQSLLIVACEFVLIFLPLAAIFLFVYSRHKKEKDLKEMKFFVPCTSDGICATCQAQNMACKTVLATYCVCMFIARPVIAILCAVYNIQNQDLTPSMISTAVYVYLCFEYCIILERCCSKNKETQTDGLKDSNHSKKVVFFVETA